MAEHDSPVHGTEQHRSVVAQRPEHTAPAVEEPQQTAQDGLGQLLQRAAGGTFSGAGDTPPPAGKGAPTALQRQHATLLSDPRLRQPMYAQRRADLFLQLQRTYGNAHAQQVADLIKAHTRPSAPSFPSLHDRYRQPRPALLQRCGATPCACSPEEKAAHPTEEELPAQRIASLEGGEQGEVAGEIHRSKGAGEPLDPAARAKLEPAMGVDLGTVSIHADSQADTLSRSVQAEAFTTGSDIYFRAGRYDPHSEGGLHLLAHELTHTVQQSKGAVSGTQHASGVSVSDPDDSFEQEAEQHARQTMARLPKTPAQPTGEVVARQATTGEGVAVQREAAVEPSEPPSTTQAPDLVVQRDVIDTLVEGGEAVAKALKAVALLLTDPGQLAAVVAEIAWNKLPESVKGQIIDKLLDAALVVVKHLPEPGAEISFLWPLLKNGLIGFVERSRSYPPDWKINVVNRIIKLKANPTTNFTQGFLKGIAKGLWDGVTGPFVLLWDLIKFEGKIIELGVKALKGLANTDKRHELMQQLKKTWQTVSTQIGQALQDIMNGKSDPAQILQWIGDLLQSVLKKANSAGASIADALLKVFEKPDAELGEALGYAEGVILFEVLLLVLTEGGYTALKEALEGVKWIGEAATTAGRWAARAAEALEPVLSALRTFGTFLKNSSKAMGSIMDAMEELFNLLIRYLKFSYGLDGAAEKAAGKGAVKSGEKAVAKGGEHAAEVLHGERQVTNALTHETHEVRLLENGAMCRASSECVELVESVHQRVSKLSGKGSADSAKEAQALEDEARKLADEAKKIKLEEDALQKSQNLTPEQLEARIKELKLKDDKVLDEAAVLEKKVGELEWFEQRVNEPGFKQRLDELAKDAAKSGKVTPQSLQEAKVGLAMEEKGLLKGPIKRDPTGAAEFIDANRTPWDIKGFNSHRPVQQGGFDLTTDAGKVERELALRENVIVDTTNMTPTHIAQLKAEAVARGWGNKVLFYP